MTASVEFANVTDPLNLGTLVTCIDEGGLGGAQLDLADIKNATGGQLQGNARVVKDEGTPRYYPNGALTMSGGTAFVDGTAVVAVGQTKNSYFVFGIKPAKDNEKHAMFDVSARKHINGDWEYKAIE